MSGFGWIEQEDAVLRQMAADGKSFGDVATALGRSRNMVAGRARRLRVAFNGTHNHRFATLGYKLTAGQAREIKSALTGAHGEQTRIARAYDISPQFVSLIAAGRRWKHA